MEPCGQLHATAALSPEKVLHATH